MNEAPSLTFHDMVSPAVLLKTVVILNLKKIINENPRQSDIPLFDLKPGKYPAINRRPRCQDSWQARSARRLSKNPQKIKKRR